MASPAPLGELLLVGPADPSLPSVSALPVVLVLAPVSELSVVPVAPPPLVASAAPSSELSVVSSAPPFVAFAAPVSEVAVVSSAPPLVALAAPSSELAGEPPLVASEAPDAPAAEEVPLAPPFEAQVVAFPGVVVKAVTVKSGLPPFFHVQHGSPKAAPLVMLEPGNLASHRLLDHV